MALCLVFVGWFASRFIIGKLWKPSFLIFLKKRQKYGIKRKFRNLTTHFLQTKNKQNMSSTGCYIEVSKCAGSDWACYYCGAPRAVVTFHYYNDDGKPVNFGHFCRCDINAASVGPYAQIKAKSSSDPEIRDPDGVLKSIK